jgi:Holliday junction resolvase
MRDEYEEDAMRRAAKTDANQAEIVAAFRRLGWSVASLHRVGDGVPDLLVARGGINVLVEVKDGAKVPSARKLTPEQVEFFVSWRGRIEIVKTVDDVIALLQESRHGA